MHLRFTCAFGVGNSAGEAVAFVVGREMASLRLRVAGGVPACTKACGKAGCAAPVVSCRAGDATELTASERMAAAGDTANSGLIVAFATGAAQGNGGSTTQVDKGSSGALAGSGNAPLAASCPALRFLSAGRNSSATVLGVAADAAALVAVAVAVAVAARTAALAFGVAVVEADAMGSLDRDACTFNVIASFVASKSRRAGG